INALERAVGEGGPPPPEGNVRKSKAVLSIARTLVPPTGEFTTDDMKAWLEAERPTRRFPMPSVRSAMRRLSDQGVVRAVARGYPGKPTWTATGKLAEAETPFAMLRLPDAAEIVLRELGPMREVDLALAIQARGNQAGSDQLRVVRSLRA